MPDSEFSDEFEMGGSTVVAETPPVQTPIPPVVETPPVVPTPTPVPNTVPNPVDTIVGEVIVREVIREVVKEVPVIKEVVVVKPCNKFHIEDVIRKPVNYLKSVDNIWLYFIIAFLLTFIIFKIF